MMNRAMEREGIAITVDPRSWAEQGREDLAALREEKTLRGDGIEARERREKIAELRRERAELPAPHLDPEQAIQSLEQQAEQQIARIREREAQELSRLDKLIAAARELATEVKERTVAVAQNVVDRVEQLRGRFESWREQQADSKPQQPLEPQKGSQTQEKQELQQAGSGHAMDPHVEQRLQVFREWYEANKQGREPAVVPDPPAKESAVAKKTEQELKIEHDRGFGHGR
jgi:hypothetical protein